MAQISGLLAGLTQGHLFIGPDQVPGEQEDPAAEGHMLRFNVIESDMGLVQFGPQRLGRLGTHMGPPHRQEVLVGLLFGDEHDITVPGAGVDPLPRQCQPIERLLEGRELAMGDPIEPQPLAAEVRQFGQPEVPHGASSARWWRRTRILSSAARLRERFSSAFATTASSRNVESTFNG